MSHARSRFAVSLSTAYGSRPFDVDDIEFSRSWRGGYQDATFRVREPLNQPASTFSRITVTDTRNARVVWQGYLDLPGKQTGDGGDQWQVGAVGGYARLSDKRRNYVLIDSAIDGWEFNYASQTGRMTASQGSLPSGSEDGEDCMLLQWNNGIAVGSGARVGAKYTRLTNSGQALGMITARHREGFNSVNNAFKLLAQTTSSGVEDVIVNLDWSVSLGWTGRFSVGGSYALNRDKPKMRIERTGAATNVDTENWWSGVTDTVIICVLHDIDGNAISGSGTYPNDYLLVHEIVTDCLQRFDPPIDRAATKIDTSFTFHHDQLTYDDPTTFADILDDLTLTTPQLWWEVLEVTGSGKHRFNVNKWDDAATPRYLATTEDGWDAPGGESDLRNRVTVSWRDKIGELQTSTYTTTVPALDQWGIVRDAELINLQDELGSPAQADRIGTQAITQVSKPPQAGTLTVAQPIVDMWSGRKVWPWEIQPGYGILIADLDIGMQPVTEVSYRDSDMSSTLTIGLPELTTDQLVAIYSKRKKRRA